MQSLLKAMNCDLQGLWIARLARDPLLVFGLLLPVWCVGARTRFLMTRCTILTFVNVFAGNIYIYMPCCRDGGGCLYTVIQWKTAASFVQGFKSTELNWQGPRMDYTPDNANRSST